VPLTLIQRGHTHLRQLHSAPSFSWERWGATGAVQPGQQEAGHTRPQVQGGRSGPPHWLLLGRHSGPPHPHPWLLQLHKSQHLDPRWMSGGRGLPLPPASALLLAHCQTQHLAG
jgi:hypothetical protein